MFDLQHSRSVIVEKESLRFAQHVISKTGFHLAEVLRTDSIMDDSNVDNDRCLWEAHLCSQFAKSNVFRPDINEYDKSNAIYTKELTANSAHWTA